MPHPFSFLTLHCTLYRTYAQNGKYSTAISGGFHVKKLTKIDKIQILILMSIYIDGEWRCIEGEEKGLKFTTSYIGLLYAAVERTKPLYIFGQTTHNFTSINIIRIFLYLCENVRKDCTYLILPKTMKECKRYLSQLFLTISPYCPFNEELR
jgi:hypothetical protein